MVTTISTDTVYDGMASQQQQQQQPQPPVPDVVSGEQYRYALSNFRIAHEMVEHQRVQLEEQERQVALLRARMTLLEGGDQASSVVGGNSVDDFSIKNSASQLERLVNRWAADIVRSPPLPLNIICDAILTDVVHSDASPLEPAPLDISPMYVQNLLRHAMSEVISEGIINCLVVTASLDANTHLTRIHDCLFARDPTVACVWRRQTFSAAVETFTPDMGKNLFIEHIPSLYRHLSLLPEKPRPKDKEAREAILVSAYAFSRMLHGSLATSSGGTADAHYRAFVPELASKLYPRQIELLKWCVRSAQGDPCSVGATVFPGLVKITRGPVTPNGPATEIVQSVVRRAQVICECALRPTPAVIANGVETRAR